MPSRFSDASGAAEVAELGRDHHALAAAFQRLAEQLFVMAFAVGVGGVEHGDAAIERGVDQRDAVGVLGRAVDAGKRHAAEAFGRTADAALADGALGQ
jgi:hypothetical protein